MMTKEEETSFINPWHACAVRVTVLALCVCLSVTARSFQPATNGNVQNYFGINLVDFQKSLSSKVMVRKSQYAN